MTVARKGAKCTRSRGSARCERRPAGRKRRWRPSTSVLARGSSRTPSPTPVIFKLMGDQVEPRREFHRRERKGGSKPSMLTSGRAHIGVCGRSRVATAIPSIRPIVRHDSLRQ